jgi:hypothetical protein
MNKITISNRFVLMIATMLPAIMLATSLTLSLIPTTTAFAQEDNEDSDNQSDINENEGGDNSVIVDPTIQTSVQTAANVNNDNDVALLGGCADINDNDEITQVNEQAADLVVHKNNDVGDGGGGGGGGGGDPTIQTSVQTAANVNTDNDVYIVVGCHDGSVKISDNDKVTQVNEQIPNQEALSDSDGPTIQTSVQTAANHNEDYDRVVYVGSPNL